MNTIKPVRIELELGGVTYKAENLPWDIDGDELLSEFKRLTVAAGFSPRMLDDEDGHWEWVRNEKC